MLQAICHCGAVRIEIPRKPRSLTNCNCSSCRRRGALWAYYRMSEVRVDAAPGATAGYIWGDKCLCLLRCATCGCVTHWEPLVVKPDSRMGVNARNCDALALGQVRIRQLDGAASWKFVG